MLPVHLLIRKKPWSNFNSGCSSSKSISAPPKCSACLPSVLIAQLWIPSASVPYGSSHSHRHRQLLVSVEVESLGTWGAHPWSSAHPGSGCRGSSLSRDPNFSLPSLLVQLLGSNLRVFPKPARKHSPPSMSCVFLRPPSIGTCP